MDVGGYSGFEELLAYPVALLSECGVVAMVCFYSYYILMPYVAWRVLRGLGTDYCRAVSQDTGECVGVVSALCGDSVEVL